MNFVEPFINRETSRRKRTINSLRRKGIYIIKEDDIIVYIGMSQSCLVEALYRHFYPYNDSARRPRHYYDVSNGKDYKIFTIETNIQDAPKLERGLVIGMNPRDNRDRFKLYLKDMMEETPF